MVKKRQTIFGAGKGNCLQGALASIFDHLEVDEIPYFQDEFNWFECFSEWCIDTLQLQPIMIAIDWNWIPKGYHLICGPSPRDGNEYHAVVGFDGKFVHDPHPSDDGLTAETFIVFVKVINE